MSPPVIIPPWLQQCLTSVINTKFVCLPSIILIQFKQIFPFCFLLIEFHFFPISYKTLTNYVYNHCIFIRIVQAVGNSFSFVLALILSTLTPLFLPSSSVPLSYFIVLVRMRKCLEKHACISSSFPIAILNGTLFFNSKCNIPRPFLSLVMPRAYEPFLPI